MNILLVGGSGMIGGHTAIHLQEQGNAVTIAARKAPAVTTPISEMPRLLGDYNASDFSAEDLRRFRRAGVCRRTRCAPHSAGGG